MYTPPFLGICANVLALKGLAWPHKICLAVASPLNIYIIINPKNSISVISRPQSPFLLITVHLGKKTHKNGRN